MDLVLNNLKGWYAIKTNQPTNILLPVFKLNFEKNIQIFGINGKNEKY